DPFPMEQHLVEQARPHEILATNRRVARVKEGCVEIEKAPAGGKRIMQGIRGDDRTTANDGPRTLPVGRQMGREKRRRYQPVAVDEHDYFSPRFSDGEIARRGDAAVLGEPKGAHLAPGLSLDGRNDGGRLVR